MDWAAETILGNGQYQIEDVLSRVGGFGMTYRAKHRILGKVVIKAPHVHRRSEPNYGDFVTCFVREAQTLAELAKKQHPNIVRVQDFFYEADVPCMVMNYVEGETLEALVTRSGAIPEATIVPWIVTMAEALDRVHELGLVHRDANPGNIVINQDNEPILIDFGIALNVQPRATTTIAAFAGHKTFAPLEQLEPEDERPDCAVSRDPKLDIYCLAATLYYAITGEYPKGAMTRQMGLFKGKDALILPQSLKPEISDRIQHAILTGMEMDPDDRPASMAEWITLLTTDDGLLSAIGLPTLESLPLQRLEFTTIELNETGDVIAEPPKSAQYFDEILDENGLALRMMMIPGGSFMMGSPEDELNSYDDEKPKHLVTVPDFAIGQLTITQAQWRTIAELPKVKRRLNPSPSYYSGEDRPVEWINWEEAIEFCDRLTRLTRKPYRLPSEAEWEYACRSGTTTPFHFGPTIVTDLANYRGMDEDRGEQGVFLGNYDKGPKGKYRGATIAAHELPPNAFGLHNMHGNVWEWCEDHWHSGYENPPINGSAWLDEDADVKSDRVVRGGSWNCSPQLCQSAYRKFFAPSNRYSNLGFRVLFRLRPPTPNSGGA
jgi:formylglycine-generating enzyme required for sulfatase activity/predicted Ser/Thr protein kinase